MLLLTVTIKILVCCIIGTFHFSVQSMNTEGTAFEMSRLRNALGTCDISDDDRASRLHNCKAIEAHWSQNGYYRQLFDETSPAWKNHPCPEHYEICSTHDRGWHAYRENEGRACNRSMCKILGALSNNQPLFFNKNHQFFLTLYTEPDHDCSSLYIAKVYNNRVGSFEWFTGVRGVRACSFDEETGDFLLLCEYEYRIEVSRYSYSEEKGQYEFVRCDVLLQKDSQLGYRDVTFAVDHRNKKLLLRYVELLEPLTGFERSRKGTLKVKRYNCAEQGFECLHACEFATLHDAAGEIVVGRDGFLFLAQGRASMNDDERISSTFIGFFKSTAQDYKIIHMANVPDGWKTSQIIFYGSNCLVVFYEAGLVVRIDASGCVSTVAAPATLQMLTSIAAAMNLKMRYSRQLDCFFLGYSALQYDDCKQTLSQAFGTSFRYYPLGDTFLLKEELNGAKMFDLHFQGERFSSTQLILLSLIQRTLQKQLFCLLDQAFEHDYKAICDCLLPKEQSFCQFISKKEVGNESTVHREYFDLSPNRIALVRDIREKARRNNRRSPIVISPELRQRYKEVEAYLLPEEEALCQLTEEKLSINKRERENSPSSKRSKRKNSL